VGERLEGKKRGWKNSLSGARQERLKQRPNRGRRGEWDRTIKEKGEPARFEEGVVIFRGKKGSTRELKKTRTPEKDQHSKTLLNFGLRSVGRGKIWENPRTG